MRAHDTELMVTIRPKAVIHGCIPKSRQKLVVMSQSWRKKLLTCRTGLHTRPISGSGTPRL